MPALYFFLPFSFAKRSFLNFLADARNDPPPPRSAPTPSSSSCPVSRNSIRFEMPTLPPTFKTGSL